MKDPVTGLFPAFLLSDGTATSDAWVRDNTYTVMCVWALSIAFRKQHELKENTAKAVELEQVRHKVVIYLDSWEYRALIK